MKPVRELSNGGIKEELEVIAVMLGKGRGWHYVGIQSPHRSKSCGRHRAAYAPTHLTRYDREDGR